MTDEQRDVIFGQEKAVVVGIMGLFSAENDAVSDVDEAVFVDFVVIWL